MVTMSSSTLASMLLRSTPGISSTTGSASGVSNMSGTGTNVRPGVVPSVFFSAPRFCCTCSSWDSPTVASLAYRDGTRLIGLCPWYEQREDAIAIFCFDLIRFDPNRDRQRPVKHATDTLAAMDARLLAIGDRLF